MPADYLCLLYLLRIVVSSINDNAQGTFMERFKLTTHTICYCLVCQLLLFQTGSSAQVTPAEDIDCTDVQIDYSDDPSLTQEERLRLMDMALFDSLNKFEFCQSIKEKSEASGGGESGGDSEDGTKESVASSSMSGTDTPSQDETGKSPHSKTTQDSYEGHAAAKKEVTGANGKLPEDIPPASNDDVLASQIRYAAENEKDPEKKKLLWDEYRKYKGLPSQKQ